MFTIRKIVLFPLILMGVLVLPAFVWGQVTLWDQPLSSANAAPYHNQDYETWDKFPESDIWIADDFVNTQAWISPAFLSLQIFVCQKALRRLL